MILSHIPTVLMADPPSDDSGSGFLAFLAFLGLALALWFLMRNMNARMRRMSYRQQAAGRTRDQPQATDADRLPDEPPASGGDAGAGQGQ